MGTLSSHQTATPQNVRPAQVSTECAGAETLGEPELHHRCAGNTVVRVPRVTTPVLTYVCGCSCHPAATR